jgi:ATP-binding cassette subfamily F protein 3
MKLDAVASRADVALQVRAYERAFGDGPARRVLFDGADLDVAAGDRVAIIGPNGSGKTTLLRDIVARGAWDDAVLRIGPSLRVGYCAQEQEVLDDARTVLDEMRAAAPMTREKAFGLLAQFLFRPDDLAKRVGTLSGGERNRLQLARLMAQQPDFLILDEPTNHLDIPACEAIEDALADFKGTILAVSHDRYFLDKIAERVIELRDGRFDTYAGNFSEYWQERQAAMPRVAARVTTRRAARDRPERKKPPPANAAAPPSELQLRIESAEREKLDLERRVSEAFTRGDHREGTRAATALERHRARLEELYRRWFAEEQ